MLSAFTVTMCFDTLSITLCIYIFVLKPEFFIFPAIRYICLKEQTADASFTPAACFSHYAPFLLFSFVFSFHRFTSLSNKSAVFYNGGKTESTYPIGDVVCRKAALWKIQHSSFRQLLYNFLDVRLRIFVYTTI